MAAVVKEPAPRIVSPVFLVLAGLCFLLPFAGVSCNTTTATAELGSLFSSSPQIGGQGSDQEGVPSYCTPATASPNGDLLPHCQYSLEPAGLPAEPAGLMACLNSLDNFNLATYTGLDLAAGSAPSAAGAEPSGCSALSTEEGSSSSIPTRADAGQIGLGAQPLLLVALLAILLGLLVSLTRIALRGLAVAVAAAVAIILLVVEQDQVSTQVLDRISHSVLNSISGTLAGHGTLGVSELLQVDITNSFTITVGIGFILAIVALGAVVLYNLAAQVVPLISGGTRAGADVSRDVLPTASDEPPDQPPASSQPEV
jgi:hypothetical protein